ncbi:PTH1 family peptidyl-tRNA hydrolase [Methylohalomonas lacus]|uniref:Peptidyl-tRNA hydrolase n=2 Tax=Methylohalomonas lacus TaxID=398773 RepID=A0AAE3HJE0_9GAMM|nr:PTH1 family peptidyl-tRNA hydrolase [Methylohalomonas lacus]
MDALTREHRINLRFDKRSQGEIGQLDGDGERCWLLKPQTFMNHSGRSLAALANYYNIPADRIIVVYDEIDLPPGTVRFKFKGGHGGHNGMRDIIQHLGTADFYRVRVGVGHPGDKDRVIPYVLGRPSRDDRKLIDESIDRVLTELPGILRGDYEKIMHRLHTKE